MAMVALGIVEFGLDLAVGDNTSAADGLLCLFPMGKGIKYIGEIGGDAIKGGSKAKKLYKAEGLLKMDLQKFGKLVKKTEGEIPWILPNSLPRGEEKTVLNILKCIDSGTKLSSSLVKKWGIKFGNYQGELPNGKYREFRVSPPAGTKNAGVRRIVGNIETGELYYTWTHYEDTGKPAFVKIR
ncbi:ribonuclease domain-containing protein [Clostridium sporogenes]|uniref:ribonuclease domain-containing protein n=1 Tax=Clostridium sporogenes TaxID=1509 RepID=UPI002238F353|nr:ribonuclease domain-containing protein [Clostridium sporogenes]MCW6111078.1 hypothetical protein [Clostridium sporogenes]